MDTILDRVADALFDLDARRAVNVKFFRGDCSTVTAEQLADELDRASDQVRRGVAVVVTDIDAYQPAA